MPCLAGNPTENSLLAAAAMHAYDDRSPNLLATISDLPSCKQFMCLDEARGNVKQLHRMQSLATHSECAQCNGCVSHMQTESTFVRHFEL